MPRQSLPNSSPPYNLVQDNNGLIRFNTDQGLVYYSRFNDVTSKLSPLLGVYDLEICEFEFFPYDPTPEVPKTFDTRISPTIKLILSQFFNKPERVMIYACDTSDGRAEQRQKLFKRWHANMEDIIQRDEQNIQVETEKEIIQLYGCVLTRKDMPHRDILQAELMDKVSGIILDKFGQ